MGMLMLLEMEVQVQFYTDDETVTGEQLAATLTVRSLVDAAHGYSSSSTGPCTFIAGMDYNTAASGPHVAASSQEDCCTKTRAAGFAAGVYDLAGAPDAGQCWFKTASDLT